MDRWSDWLFEEHSEVQLRAWARRLGVFRLVRAVGGHANDGDRLLAAFGYPSLQMLERALVSLGIATVQHDVAPPQPEVGRAYPGDVFAAFVSLIPGSLVEQPGWQQIQGGPVFVWCNADEVRFSVADGYAVTDANVAHALRLEPLLRQLGLKPIDPPVDNRHCISPRYYPDYFDA
ncbi:hypothetical protein LL962_00235 [Xanthomonas sp. NCPPB 1067]|uniref:hypothetical protein n=1 Tax=Xanthomonas TaxID=338 RepID=UPI001E59FD08|nr:MULTISPECIES: hypothetical protein [Xanthomonas]MCC4585550.1 hypothetical protein [Xanthomonas sp. NCPPB 1067]MCD0246304.1 hypothetical protein [Xanthomonas melonis]